MSLAQSQLPAEHRTHFRVQRSESIKSDRSDKRVSFNKDVNVKNIPRVQKTQVQVARQNNHHIVNDEWAKCTKVYLEPTPLNTEEKLREAEKLLQLVDNVVCSSPGNSKAVNTKSLDRPSRAKYKNKHYQNVLINNAKNINNNLKGGVQSNGPHTLSSLQTSNSLRKPIKEDFDNTQYKSVNIPKNVSPYVIRHHSADHILETDIDSPPISSQDQRLRKSVPSLPNIVYQDNIDVKRFRNRNLTESNSNRFKSADNLFDIHENSQYLTKSGRTIDYNSADDILEASQINNLQYKDFKSVGNIPNSISDNNWKQIPTSQDYSPKVGNVIKKFNHNVVGSRISGSYADNQPEYNPDNQAEPNRGPKQPNHYNNHNNNKPFSYTGELATLSSVEAVRRITPPREFRSSPPHDVEIISKRESPPREPPVFAQTYTTDRRSLSEGRLTKESNHHRTQIDHGYSAKIIITDDGHRPQYNNPYKYNPYHHETFIDSTQDKEENKAYERYQVPTKSLNRVIHGQRIMSSEDFLDDNMENNNIHMSSKGVQTDVLPKTPFHANKIQKSSSSNTQYSHDSLNRTYQQNKQKNNYTRQRDYSSQTTDQVIQPSYITQKRSKSEDNVLSSSSLVRRINHGFGGTARSPSPPSCPREVQQPSKNVVPLLSDTSDSEGEVYINVDPLAKIREQVRQREKHQEEEEEKEEGYHLRLKDRKAVPYRSVELTPLTIDEVDALNLEVDNRKTLVVASQDILTKVTETNHHGRQFDIVKNQLHSPPHEIPYRPQKPPREKNNALRSPPAAVNIISPVERNRKSSLEKVRDSKEVNKQREPKDKKKKIINIKFFYDPRPQDDPNVDPLAKFQEYRGPPSNDRISPKDERSNEDLGNGTSDDLDEEYYDNRINRLGDYNTERKTEICNGREDYRDRRGSQDHILEQIREKRRSSREGQDNDRRTPSKDRGTSRERGASRERSPSREYTNNKILTNIGSRDRRENSAQRDKRENSIEKREHSNVKRSSSTARRDLLNSEDSGKDNRLRAVSRSRSRENHISHDEIPIDYHINSDEYDEDEDYDAYEERVSTDESPGRKLSDKYLSTQLYDPPDETHSVVDDLAAETLHPTDDDENEKKIWRQRKKFFSVFKSDRKAKTASYKAQSSSQLKNDNINTLEKKKGILQTRKKNKGQSPPNHSHPDIVVSSYSKSKQQKYPVKKKKKRSWPWAFLGLRGSGGGRKVVSVGDSNPTQPTMPGHVSSRTSSRASSRASSHRPHRPSVRASKIHREGLEERIWINRENEDDSGADKFQQYENSTLNISELKSRHQARNNAERSHSSAQRKYSTESSESSTVPISHVIRNKSFKKRYFGDSDAESISGGVRRVNSEVGDYRSLPNRSSRAAVARKAQNNNHRNGPRRMSPGGMGSAGSSLQTSESEGDSHGGSHASQASKISHVSTGSNRSVYLHAMAVAEIPVRRPDEVLSNHRLSQQSKKVSRSFSLLAPKKARNFKEQFEVEYDNHEVSEVHHHGGHGKLPPRPPRKTSDDNKTSVNRSSSMYRDNRLAGWLKRRKSQETKGI